MAGPRWSLSRESWRAGGLAELPDVNSSDDPSEEVCKEIAHPDDGGSGGFALHIGRGWRKSPETLRTLRHFGVACARAHAQVEYQREEAVTWLRACFAKAG